MPRRLLPLLVLILLATSVAAEAGPRREDVTVSGIRLVPTRDGHVVVHAELRNVGVSPVQGAVRFQVTPDGGRTHVMVQSFGTLGPGRATSVRSDKVPAAPQEGRGEFYRLRVEVIPDLPTVAAATPLLVRSR